VAASRRAGGGPEGGGRGGVGGLGGAAGDVITELPQLVAQVQAEYRTVKAILKEEQARFAA